MSKFLHDLGNLIAIVQGKVRQAEKLMLSFEDQEIAKPVQLKLQAALKEIERIETLFRGEKAEEEKRSGEAAGQKKEERRALSLKGRTVLVVDDESGYREVLSDEFDMVGATVLTARNGTEAFDLLQKHKIDAVISDVRMPNGSGVELLEKAKAMNPKTPVVMLITGFSDLSTEDAYDKGADAIFSKPCDLDALVTLVHHALLPERERWVRAFERKETDFAVDIRLESLGIAVKARVLNVGRGGMFIAMEGSLPEADERVFLEVKTTDDPVFQGTGICRWRRLEADSEAPKGIGVEFLDMSESSFRDLLKFLDETRPTAFIPKGPVSR